MAKRNKVWKIQERPKHNLVKRVDNGMTIYSNPLHDELAKTRKRLQEIYKITAPLRKEVYNLRKRHEELDAEISGVKIK